MPKGRLTLTADQEQLLEAVRTESEKRDERMREIEFDLREQRKAFQREADAALGGIALWALHKGIPKSRIGEAMGFSSHAAVDRILSRGADALNDDEREYLSRFPPTGAFL